MSGRTAAEAMRRQFDSTYEMLVKLVELCPDGVWLEDSDGAPFWLYVYHIVYYMDFWLRDSYGGDVFGTFAQGMSFDPRIGPELHDKVYAGVFVSRPEMRRYLEVIHAKTAGIFDALTDRMLGVPIVEGKGSSQFPSEQFTYADVISGQIRHVMYNIGYLNGILRRHGLPASEWYASNEPEGA